MNKFKIGDIVYSRSTKETLIIYSFPWGRKDIIHAQTLKSKEVCGYYTSDLILKKLVDYRNDFGELIKMGIKQPFSKK